MKAYTVDFHTDADFATLGLKARSGKDALRKARALAEKQAGELAFTPHDGGQAVNEIVVRDDDDNEVATWYDAELRLRLAASDLLDAAKLALRELRGFYNDDESEAVLVLIAAIAKATGSRS